MFKTALAITCLLSGLSAGAQLPADLILLHGKILTVDAQDSIAQAVAIRQGKIVAVGKTSRSCRLPARKPKSSIFMEEQPRQD